jgi:DNA-binding transcriptional ArsR family regulator
MMNEKPFKQCSVVCFDVEKIAAIKNRLPAERELTEAARRHKVLGHPVRQAILHALRMEECCVCDLAEILGKPVSTVSQHLRMLASVGLLEYRQQGKLVFYSLARNEEDIWHPRAEAIG